jgi:hypothetical protein
MSADLEDPTRWAEDLEAPEGVAGALQEAREDLPSDAQIAVLAAKLGPLLGGGGGGAGGGSGGAGPGSGGAVTATGMASGTKVGLGLLIASVVISALGSWAVIEDRRARPRQVPEDTPEIVADGGASSDSAGDVEESTPREDTGISGEGTGEGPGAGTGMGMGAGTGAGARMEAERGAGAGVPPELVLLEEAQDALGREPGRALGLADQHARIHPNGMLAQEREVLAVDALLRLGRRAEAEARADRLRAAHPGSSQIRRLDRLLAPD